MQIDQARAIFTERGVTTALVVDDVYDPFERYEQEDLERGFALFEASDDLAPAFEAVGGAVPPDPENLGAQIAASVALAEALEQARQGDAGPLQELGNAVFGRVADDRAGRLKPLEDLIRVLGELGVTVTTVGSDGPGGQGAPKYPLIFMDYYLGSKGAPSIEKSRQRIEEIVSHYGPDEMPLVVLMSSELKKDKEAGKFREQAKLLGSQFKFARKAEFEDDSMEFVSSLATMVRFLPQTRTIGAFVKAWSGALSDAIKDFEKAVMGLDLQDYFQIRTKLGEDAAARFGDHVSGLFDGFLRRLVEDKAGLRSATASMNALSFAGRPPSPFAPSETVVKMADAAAFQSLPEPLPAQPGRLDVELGDVFISDTGTGTKRVKKACVVISQACDLEHGKTQTVLLLKGVVTKRTGAKVDRVPGNRPIIRTDLFMHEGDNLIIDWDASDLMTLPVDGFIRQMGEMAYEKVARLRSMQALALQQRFAAHLTRVGLPDSPPPYRYPNIEVLIRRGGGKERLFDPVRKGGLACVIGDERQEVVLQEQLLTRIATSLAGVNEAGLDAAELEKARALLGNWQERQKLLTVSLEGSKAQIGNVAIMDRETPMAAGDGMPKDSFLAISLYP
ncbi:MAG: hypothetical protein ACEQR8_00075 [Cypionkella sp.]